MNLQTIKHAAAPAFLILCLSAAVSAAGQPATPRAISPVTGLPAPELTKFDLDFPGGTPKELVAAIQKSMARPLNVIIPEDSAETRLPALKMKNVDVPQLFRALESAGQFAQKRYGFRANDIPISDDTIWAFYMERPNPQATFRDCRFYSLAPYLDRGLTVDDITTAIRTGAKMLGENQQPEISFHKDTKLLIAVGEPSKLQIIDAVLRALEPMKTKPVTGEKKAEEKAP